MEPERGDRSVEVTRADVTRAAREVGVVPGDTLSSTARSQHGHGGGGPDTVIDGFLTQGLRLWRSTLCNWAPGGQHLVFPVLGPSPLCQEDHRDPAPATGRYAALRHAFSGGHHVRAAG